MNGFCGLMQPEKEIIRFRDEIKAYFGVKHCFLVSSGKAALTIILQGLHALQPRRCEVLVPAFCCYSVPSAIIRAGLAIRLCDVNPSTMDFDFAQLPKAVSGKAAQIAADQPETGGLVKSRLLAILPVHLFGLCADVERARRQVADPGVTVVEDAAQVMGTELAGRKVGTIGDVGFFSLGRGKALSAVEGGVIITNRDDIAESIAQRVDEVACASVLDVLRQLVLAVALAVFQRPTLFWIPKSLPFLRLGETIFDTGFPIRKLSGFQAGLAKAWQERLARFTEARQKASDLWDTLRLPPVFERFHSKNGSQLAFMRYPIKVKEQAIWGKLLRTSQAEGLGVMLTYPQPIHRITQLKDNFRGQDFCAAERLSKEIITLPVHPMLSDRDRQRIEAFILADHGALQDDGGNKFNPSACGN
jgi:dTDP-4-amino-4,6-dideoxygalactose transaminase